MSKNLRHYECDGQMNIFDYIESAEKVYSVDIIGLCDDPICSNCDYEFSMFDSKWSKNEIDIERCPNCGARLDWERWHRVNDNE